MRRLLSVPLWLLYLVAGVLLVLAAGTWLGPFLIEAVAVWAFIKFWQHALGKEDA